MYYIINFNFDLKGRERERERYGQRERWTEREMSFKQLNFLMIYICPLEGID